MQSKMILLGTVAALSLTAAQQSSAHNHGWYIGLEAGANWVDDTDFVFDVNAFPPPAAIGTIDFDTGWAGLGTVGYGFDSNWRIELELGYRQNDTDTFFVGKRLPTSGDLTEYSAMINVIYDVPLSERLDLSIGLGAGADFSQFDDGVFLDDSDTTFAYQAIAGLSYALTDRLDLTLNYRYFHANEPEFAESTPFNTYALEDLEKHTVTVGLRYDLWEDEAPMAPAAPPAPPPSEAPAAKQFIVFFGFNKSNLTPEAQDVIKEAAAAAKEQGSATILVVGHTDTVGSNRYNDALALRRSGAVKKGLAAEGVPPDMITTSGKGETELLVQTGDNVKEPQNRRATIDLH